MLRKRPLLLLAAWLLGGCATMPTGPSVRVLPPPGKPFDLFQQEEATCRRWAAQQIGVKPGELAGHDTAVGALVGTGVGAGLGALLGSASGNGGVGAALGGITGGLIGASAGSDEGVLQGREAQRRYDTAYLQCMTAYGNQEAAPVYQLPRRRVIVVPPEQEYYAPVPGSYYPPPPSATDAPPDLPPPDMPPPPDP